MAEYTLYMVLAHDPEANPPWVICIDMNGEPAIHPSVELLIEFIREAREGNPETKFRLVQMTQTALIETEGNN